MSHKHEVGDRVFLLTPRFIYDPYGNPYWGTVVKVDDDGGVEIEFAKKTWHVEGGMAAPIGAHRLYYLARVAREALQRLAEELDAAELTMVVTPWKPGKDGTSNLIISEKDPFR